jgi:hypothetical protein
MSLFVEMAFKNKLYMRVYAGDAKTCSKGCLFLGSKVVALNLKVGYKVYWRVRYVILTLFLDQYVHDPHTPKPNQLCANEVHILIL